MEKNQKDERGKICRERGGGGGILHELGKRGKMTLPNAPLNLPFERHLRSLIIWTLGGGKSDEGVGKAKEGRNASKGGKMSDARLLERTMRKGVNR